MNRFLWAAAAGLLVAGISPVAAQTPGSAANNTATTPQGSRAALRPATAARAVPRATPTILPGTRSNVFTTIQGNALNSTNGALADAPVRLRDVRLGRIVDVATTDKSGLFAFHGVDPGSYVVEIVGNDQVIMAASQIINVSSGEAVSAVVKLPFRLPAFGGLLGATAQSTPTTAALSALSSLTPTATELVKAANGVIALVNIGDPVSPR